MTRRVTVRPGQLQGAIASLTGIAGCSGRRCSTQTFAAFIGPQADWHLPGAPHLLSTLLLVVAAVAPRGVRPDPPEPSGRSIYRTPWTNSPGFDRWRVHAHRLLRLVLLPQLPVQIGKERPGVGFAGGIVDGLRNHCKARFASARRSLGCPCLSSLASRSLSMPSNGR